MKDVRLVERQEEETDDGADKSRSAAAAAGPSAAPSDKEIKTNIKSLLLPPRSSSGRPFQSAE